ncbi:hypothetical protein IV102_33365 [bacterium]|nr:hypothetical protein [bacterium]
MALNGLGAVVGGVLKAVAGGDKTEGKKEVAQKDNGAGNLLGTLMKNKVAEQARIAKEMSNLINN